MTQSLDLYDGVFDAARKAALERRFDVVFSVLIEASDVLMPPVEFHVAAADLLREFDANTEALGFVQRALEIAPEHKKSLRDRFDLLASLGHLERAAEALEALTEHADEGDAQFLQSRKLRLLRAGGKLEDAYITSLPTIKAYPEDFYARTEMIFAMIGVGRLDHALQEIRACLEMRPDHLWLGYWNVRINLTKGNRAAALMALSALEQVDATSLQVGLAQAELAGFDDDLSKAFALFEEMFDRFPTDSRAPLRLADLYLGEDQPELALEYCDRALLVNEDHVVSVISRARCLDALGRSDEARSDLEGLVASNQATPGVFQLLSTMARISGDHARQSKYLEQGLQRFPDCVFLLEQLVREAAIGKTPVLADELPDVFQSNFLQTRADKLRIEVLLASFDYEDAWALLRLSFSKQRSAQEAAYVGQAMIGLNRAELAKRYLRLALRKWPDAKGVMWQLSRAFMRLYQDQEALAELPNLVSVKLGQSESFHQVMSSHHCRVGQLEPALKHLKLAGVEKVKNLESLGLLVRHLISAGDAEATEHLFKEVFNTNMLELPHFQATYVGQLVTETRLEFAAGSEGAMCPVPDGDVNAHANLVQRLPDSSVSGLRLLRTWASQPSVATQVKGGGYCQPSAPKEMRATIPKTIIQFWDSPAPPEGIVAMMDSWRAAPGFEHKLFNQTEALRVLREDFGSAWVRAFRLANNVAEATDLFRLCMLAQHGGIYADADDILVGSLPMLVSQAPGLVVYAESGWSLGNNFMACRPKHPAIVLAAQLARQALLMRSNETTWSKTGPGLLTRSVAQYISECLAKGTEPDLMIPSIQDMIKHVAMHNPARHKKGGGHWKKGQRGKTDDGLRKLLQSQVRG